MEPRILIVLISVIVLVVVLLVKPGSSFGQKVKFAWLLPAASAVFAFVVGFAVVETLASTAIGTAIGVLAAQVFDNQV